MSEVVLPGLGVKPDTGFRATPRALCLRRELLGRAYRMRRRAPEVFTPRSPQNRREGLILRVYPMPSQFARAHDAKQQFLTSDFNCSSD